MALSYSEVGLEGAGAVSRAMPTECGLALGSYFIDVKSDRVRRPWDVSHVGIADSRFKAWALRQWSRAHPTWKFPDLSICRPKQAVRRLHG